MWLIEKYEKEIPRLKDVVKRAKDLLSGAKQYDRLSASVYSILDEVKDVVDEGIEKLEKEEESNRIQQVNDTLKLVDGFAEEISRPLLMRVFPGVCKREIIPPLCLPSEPAKVLPVDDYSSGHTDRQCWAKLYGRTKGKAERKRDNYFENFPPYGYGTAVNYSDWIHDVSCGGVYYYIYITRMHSCD